MNNQKFEYIKIEPEIVWRKTWGNSYVAVNLKVNYFNQCDNSFYISKRQLSQESKIVELLSVN